MSINNGTPIPLPQTACSKSSQTITFADTTKEGNTLDYISTRFKDNNIQRLEVALSGWIRSGGYDLNIPMGFGKGGSGILNRTD